MKIGSRKSKYKVIVEDYENKPDTNVMSNTFQQAALKGIKRISKDIDGIANFKSETDPVRVVVKNPDENECREYKIKIWKDEKEITPTWMEEAYHCKIIS